MNIWIFTITISAIILTSLSLILPQTGIGNFIKGFFPLIMVLIIIKPILNFDFYSFFNENFDNNSYSEVYMQEDFIEEIINKKITNLEQISCVALQEKGYTNSSVKIFYEVNENGNYNILKITINLKNSVILSDNKHIDINEIKNIVSSLCLVNFSVVEILE